MSLGTIELKPRAAGTKLLYTEQAVFLDGFDDAGGREHGTKALLDNLVAMVERVMMPRSVEHGTIRLERRYRSPPARVFAAWAEPQARARWDVPGRWAIAEQSFDFREGGREIKRFGPREDPRFMAETLYLDIVPARRIVFSYSMTSHGTPVSVSLTTVELSADGAGTHLLLTEQVAFLDGRDNEADRREGLASMLDKIGESLSSA